MAINSVTFSGNIGGDIEIRFTQNSKCIGTFSLPVDQGFGENKKTSWIKCKILGERAQKLQPYLVKGAPVTVTGQFVEETWKKDGQDRHANVVIVDQLQFASQGKQQGGPQQNQGQQQPQQQPQNQNQGFQNQGFQGQQQGQGFGNNAQQPNPQNSGAPQPSNEFDDDVPF